MTAEERAADIVQSLVESRGVRFVPGFGAVLKERIAAAIRAAVAEEREACARTACRLAAERVMETI